MTPVGRIVVEAAAVMRMGGPACLAEYSISIARRLPQIMRTGTLTAADEAMAHRRRSFRVLDQVIHLPGWCFAAAREIYGRQVYFAVPPVVVAPGDVVVDLGANVGVFTVLAARVGARVVAVEAQGGFIPLIREHASENGVGDWVALVNALVGAKTGVLSVPGNLRAASHFDGVPPTMGMNELIDSQHLDRIDFLKVDIEGSEFDLFSGEIEWLSRVRKIAMEVHCTFGDPDAIVRVLEEAGFVVQLTNNDLKAVNAIGASTGYLFAFRR